MAVSVAVSVAVIVAVIVAASVAASVANRMKTGISQLDRMRAVVASIAERLFFCQQIIKDNNMSQQSGSFLTSSFTSLRQASKPVSPGAWNPPTTARLSLSRAYFFCLKKTNSFDDWSKTITLTWSTSSNHIQSDWICGEAEGRSDGLE